ncbi:8304_t:CDS:2 [Paraglomus brasilianum]|uniref:8304_t:CDS:1 n=1 Tax=Paraglomus brasilianum TaxID=144538 RepID=A0A9N8WCG1_9GLOM|nr:8304_t:CDS:2 [Paraglomus brasilianum]
MTETDVMELPPARIGLVIGAKGKTIAEIREQSKAHIYIDGHKAIIRGSEEARKEAMRLINRKVRIEPTIHPHIGYTVLELPESETLPKLKFISYDDVDFNTHTRGKRLYCTFSTIAHSRLRTIEDWCDLNRERHGFQSSFQHYAPDMIKRIWKILQKFGFEEVTQSKRSSMNKDVKTGTSDLITIGEKNEEEEGNQSIDNDIDGRKGSVCITYDGDDKVRKKLKLHWDYEEGVYKITKATTQIRRVAIVDIVSGTSAPDIRFLLKTHKDEGINAEMVKLISDLQTSPLELFDGTYFQSKHLRKQLDVDSIRQSMTKRKFVNNRFQLSVITTRKEVRASRTKFAAPVEEQTINLKHLSWKMYQTNGEIRQVYDKDSLEHSIRETVAFARKLCRILES